MSVKSKDKADPPLDEATSEEFDAFEELARKLVHTPKAEIDAKIKAAKNGHGS